MLLARVVSRFSVEHAAAGLRALVQRDRGRAAGPARTWSGTGPRRATSCVPACLARFPARPGCSASSIPAISLAFLARFDCQHRASWLAEKRLAAWLEDAGYRGRTSPAEPHQRLSSAPRGATGGQGAASAPVTRAPAAVLASLNTQIKALEAQIAAQLAAHADGHICTSLPRSGTVRAARLLSGIGGCRARFPHPQALICLAGAAPPARQSGQHKAVTFRWPVSKQPRDAACDLADGSRHAHARAARIHNDAIARGKDHRTRCASRPERGCMCSGTAGRTTPPATLPATAPCSACSPPRTPPQNRPPDT
jgi:Transposase IS116/IS110/IS902 family